MDKFVSKQALKSGSIPGLIATLCCLGPLILIMMGLLSASTALSFTVYKGWFLTLSIIMLVGTLWFYIKRREANNLQWLPDEK